ncbi:hypothetical protein [Streptomyces violaceus]|uniref:Uncharacterized protein n=1 Tax=Streptomyces violaceus TaxID=1936 RepID=A0ABY9UBN6_STRVL|nr:hypothetical protein [Streptomyces janthinus]WND19849.1 hypothetical protein RI060_21935 [Streptomyces janthinus]GGS93020.1 hypothetical protein GCM10010270_76400 [Streptomyces janthinus]
MAWEAGWYYLGAGETGTYWVSWGDTWQGLQFIAADPRGGTTRLHVESHGIQKVAQFGASPLTSYWVTVTNYGDGSNFVLMGQQVG